jgi:hypothetical protein
MPGSPVHLVRAEDGGAARLETSFSLFHDSARLYVAFAGADREEVSTHLEHDAPLWQEDVVEIFLAPETLTRYFEIEVSPRGTIFDAIISSPDLDRRTMSVDLSWSPPGLWAATQRRRCPLEERSWETVLSIPFAALHRQAPQPGERWRANLFRIDRSPSGDELLAWRPTGRRPADFHVPDAFGSIVFEG